MSWYRSGTVSVTNGSTLVSGTGTAFIANTRSGDAFIGPDGNVYEITNAATESALSIAPPYQGATASGQAYGVAPMQGYVKASADRLRQVVEEYATTIESIQPWATASTPAAAREDLELGTSSTQDADAVAITGGSVSGLSALSVTGNLTFVGTGRKILADFSNSTVANRAYLETSTANSRTTVGIKPSGSGNASDIQMHNSSDPANSSRFRLTASASAVSLTSDAIGSGTILPVNVTVGGVVAQTISTAGDTGFGVTPDTSCKIQSANGIKVGNTVNANNSVLDWVEKRGTFPPLVAGSTSAGSGTYPNQVGTYTRLADRIFFNILLQWSGHTGTGNLTITGLPFVSYSSGPSVFAVSFDGLTVGTGKQLVGHLGVNSSTMTFFVCDLAGWAISTLPMDSAVTSLRVTGSYPV